MDERHADRMRKIVLLGNPKTKRTIYFAEHAAREIGLHVQFQSWENWHEWISGESYDSFLKIDPPLWKSCELGDLNNLIDEYKKKLDIISRLAAEKKITFFNHPKDILALLDKRGCKKTLLEAGLPVTAAIEENIEEYGEKDVRKGTEGKIETLDHLLEIMIVRHIHQVFIKPVNGSGAAGVSAFRYQPKYGKMVLYTCTAEDGGTSRLVNTKKLRRITNCEEISRLMNGILKLDCIVEHWYPKAEHDGFSYDLRVVMQDGNPDFLLARLSKGPVTNLHLNNHPLPFEELRLPSNITNSVIDLCKRAMDCYPGLRSAGIDILLEKGSLKPRIIEMNGQGDLIYQDIYNENKIYLHQARMMKEEEGKCEAFF